MKQSKEFVARASLRCVASLLGTIALILALPGSAAAQCTGPGYNKIVNLRLPATITVPNHAVVGTVLTTWALGPSSTNDFYCHARFGTGIAADTRFLIDSKVSVHYGALKASIKVWNTNVPGIGVAVAHRWHVCGWSGWASGSQHSLVGGICSSTTFTPIGSSVAVALVKTGPIKSGVIKPMTVMQAVPVGVLRQNTPFQPISPLRTTYRIGQVTIAAQTCQVMTPTRAVRLSPTGGLPASSFTGRNSTSNPVMFSLRIRCSDVPFLLGVTFTDANNPGNRSNILPLTRESSATGLGVQILHHDSPVSFGRDSNTLGNPGQVLLDQLGSSSVMDLPFSARYIQTGQAVTPGNADARATFTTAYQ